MGYVYRTGLFGYHNFGNLILSILSESIFFQKVYTFRKYILSESIYFPKVWKAYSFHNCGTRKAQSYIHIYMYMYVGLGFPGTRILESICFPYFPKVWKAYSYQNCGTWNPPSY